MMSIRVYVTEWCGACKTELPRIRESAHKLGYTVSVIDIDRCPVNLKPKCSGVEFVPHVELNGSEITVNQLVDMAQSK